MAVATLNLSINSTVWSSVGVGIWRIYTGSIPIMAIVADTQPAPSTMGTPIAPGPVAGKFGTDTSTTWVRSKAGPANIVAIPQKE